MEISRDVGINPGLFPVVQVMTVELVVLTGQLTPSIVTFKVEASVGKLTPVNDNSVPPVTVPYLGLIESSLEVKALEYVTLLEELVI